MANALFNALGNNYSSIVNKAKEIQKTFKGNPKKEVERLIRSGQMSQQQFNELAAKANEIMRLTSELVGVHTD